MKAYTIQRYSKKNTLQFAEMPEPILKENDVLVEVHAAGVNLLDSKIRNGEFKLILPYKFPLILGHDVAGVVVKIGSGVQKFKEGDKVYARPADYRIGTFAELIAIDETDVAIKPRNLTMEEAASIPLVGLTAWQTLVEKANIQKGQKVLIQAGSGGVGSFAIQLAKHLGATVATTTSESNFELVKSLGADIVIDYRKDDFETILKDYDLVLHSQDVKTLEKSLRILKPGGKLISISGPPDTDFAAEITSNWFIKTIINLLSLGVRKKAKKQKVIFQFLFMRAQGNQLNEITKMIESGIIRPVVDKVFPFEKVNEAMAYVESGRSKGKVVVKVK
ncbi:NADP-dependent oxidoreductase [Leptospira vanthielii]|uniref:NADP-dependent oxidoreductase n=2 Tax=Leptospira vanthielii TaxID=293085 RepID=A0ABY2NTQ9_9LEPT|nr:NADP-dependent oxidoreductase [Leptospira vanthielii]EMY69782.1 oxidoreductase, zinc-binding dehydrogenase family protein [Leptospira vanthielii serovar Holland str. Waz Holland = ATCC 700522]TGM61471.1 NADP-dependent oxidoreductase [Leptospira vanthielii]